LLAKIDCTHRHTDTTEYMISRHSTAHVNTSTIKCTRTRTIRRLLMLMNERLLQFTNDSYAILKW